MKNLLRAAILTSLFASPTLYADPISPVQGTIQVTVVDENGTPVQEAPVYIYGVNRTHFVGGADVAGSTTFTMKEGDYRISSAFIKRSGDEVVDRFASNEARVTVTAGDNLSIILTLRPISNPDAPALTSYATLHVAELPGNLFNNN